MTLAAHPRSRFFSLLRIFSSIPTCQQLLSFNHFSTNLVFTLLGSWWPLIMIMIQMMRKQLPCGSRSLMSAASPSTHCLSVRSGVLLTNLPAGESPHWPGGRHPRPRFYFPLPVFVRSPAFKCLQKLIYQWGLSVTMFISSS